VLQCVAVCCSVLQCVAVSCSVLQCVAVRSVYLAIRRICPTGWPRLIGCLISRVIFRKRATNYRALSWKMTYEDKACYASTPPCTCATSGDDLYRSLLTGQHVKRDVYKSSEILQQIKRNLTTIRLLCRTCAAYVHGQHFKRDLHQSKETY